MSVIRNGINRIVVYGSVGIAVVAFVLLLKLIETNKEIVKLESTNTVLETKKTELAELQARLEEEKRFKDFVFFINPNISIKDFDNLKEAIKKYSVDCGLSEIELLSLCGIESGLNRFAVSDTDDIGLCQINIGLYRTLARQQKFEQGPEALTEIDFNLKVATILLKLNREIIEKVFAGASESYKKSALMVSYNKGIGKAIEKANKCKDDRYLKKLVKIKEKY